MDGGIGGRYLAHRAPAALAPRHLRGRPPRADGAGRDRRAGARCRARHNVGQRRQGRARRHRCRHRVGPPVPYGFQPARCRPRSVEAQRQPRCERHRRDSLAVATLSRPCRSSRGCRLSILDNHQRVDLAGGAQLLFRARHRPGRGRRRHRRPHRHAEGGPQRSRQADRRVPVRRTDRHRQDGARQDARRVPVRHAGAHDPPRHERVPDGGIDGQDSRQRRHRQPDRLADHAGAQAAVLGGAARRVREGARQRLGPVPAGVRRRAAHRPARPGRRLPPLHHHPHLQPRRHEPPRRAPRLLARGRRLFRRAGPAGGRPDVPSRVPEPPRQGDRVPAAVARADARHPEKGAGARARPARLQGPRMGGRVGGLGARIPARARLHARDGRAAP